MEVVTETNDLERYMLDAVVVSGKNPVLIDRFLNNAIELMSMPYAMALMFISAVSWSISKKREFILAILSFIAATASV